MFDELFETAEDSLRGVTSKESLKLIQNDVKIAVKIKEYRKNKIALHKALERYII